MRINELQAQREKLAAEIKNLAGQFDQSSGVWADASNEANWEKVNADYDAVMSQIEQANRVEVIQKRVADLQDSRPAPSPLTRTQRTQLEDSPLANLSGEAVASKAVQGFIRGRLGMNLSVQQQAAVQAVRTNIHSEGGGPELELGSLNSPGAMATFKNWQQTFQSTHPSRQGLLNAALTTTTGSSGGNTISAETLMPQFERAMLAFGSLRQQATVWATSSGEPLVFASMNDTSNSGRLVAESTLVDNNAGGGAAGDGGPNPTFSKTTWNAYKYTSDTIILPYELLEDNNFNVLGHLLDSCAERLARITETHFATGDDSGKPQGIEVGSNTGLTVAGGAAITTDELITFQHSLNPSYRAGAAWMMHDNVVMYIRKLKDGQNNYIWASGFNGGAPDSLLGAPLYVNNSMTSTLAVNNYVMVYGQLNKYYIRRVGGLRLRVLNELYAAKDQIGVVGFLREDGGVFNAGGNPIKRLRMAAA